MSDGYSLSKDKRFDSWANRTAGNAAQMSDAGGGLSAVGNLAPEVATSTAPEVSGGDPLPGWFHKGWNTLFGNAFGRGVARYVGHPVATVLHPVAVAAEYWNRDVYQPLIDDTVVGLDLMLAAPVARAKDESLGDYLKYAWNARKDFSIGQADAAVQEEYKLDDPNAFQDPIHNPTAFKEHLNPISIDPNTGQPMVDPVTGEALKRDVNWHTGTTDFFASMTLDPLNYVGGPTKALVAGLRAPKIVDDIAKAQEGWSRTRGVISVDRVNTLLDEGKYDPMLRRMTEITDPKVARAYIEELKLGADDPDTLAYLSSRINDVRGQRALLTLALRPASKEGQDAATWLQIMHGADLSYYASLYAGSDPLLAEALQSAGDLMLGPKTREVMDAIVKNADLENEAALKRAMAVSQGVYKMRQAPAGTLRNAPTTSSLLERKSFRAAARQTAGYSDDPIVTRYKPHRWHPTTWYIEKPSGLVEPGSADAFDEISAAMRQLDRLTNGEFTREVREETGQTAAAEFTDRWFRASTLTDPESARGAVAAALNDYAVNKLLKMRRPNMAPQERRMLTESLLEKGKKVTAEIKEKGYLTVMLEDGNTAIVKHPILQRATPNAVSMYDYREFDRAIQRHDWSLLAQDALSGGTNGLDNLMGLWKISVLVRLGYTQRNLAEAALSMGATGQLGHVLSEVGAERMGTWSRSAALGAGRVIDNIGVAGGIANHPEMLWDTRQAWDGARAATQASADTVVASLDPKMIKRLAKTDPQRAAELEAIRVDLADKTVTHHASDIAGSAWTRDKGRVISTAKSRTLAENNAPAGGGTHEVTSYGETLDLTGQFAPPELDHGTFLQAKAGDQGAIQRLSDAAWNHGYGRIILPDGPQWKGQQIVVNQRAVGAKGRKAVVENRIKRYVNEATPAPATERLDPMKRGVLGGKARRARRKQVSAHRQGLAPDLPINPDYDQILTDAMLSGGAREFAQALVDRRAALDDQVDFLTDRLENARTRKDRTAPLRSKGRGFGQGTDPAISRRGNRYDEAAGAYGGHGGGWWEQRMGADVTYSMTAGDSYRSQLSSGAMASLDVAPTNPRYFESWANMINLHFRDHQSGWVDPVVQKAIDGEDFNKIYDWATETAEGYQWAHSIGITDLAKKDAQGVRPALGRKATKDTANAVEPEDIETAVAGLMTAVDLYLPQGPIRDAFWAGEEITQDTLRNASEGKTLQPLQGRLIPTSWEARKGRSDGWKIQKGIGNVMKVLGSIPESSWARHPLFVTAFREERRNLLALAEEAKVAKAQATGDLSETGRLTADEWHKIEATAHTRAQRTVEKTLYTINRRSTLSGNLAIRTLSPFIAAHENTLQRWTSFLAADPSIPLRYVNNLNKISQNGLVVDEDGNPVKPKEWTGKAVVVLPAPLLPGSWGKAMDALASSVKIPIKSFDVLTQGNPVNPGIGPLPTLPLVELMRRQPSAQQWLKWIVPYGVPEGNMDILMPTALKRAEVMLGDSQQYANTMSKASLILADRWEKGGRQGPAPTVDDAQKLTDSMTHLRFAASLVLPVATSFTNEHDFYAAKLRDYQEQYGQDDGETRFFADFPDTWKLVESLSRNPTGVRANAEAVANAKKYRAAINAAAEDGAADVEGFIMNYGVSSDAEFSQAAYQWQLSNGPNKGSEPFRGRANPQDQVRESQIREGWDYYMKYVRGAEAQLALNGVDPKSTQYRQTMEQVRKGATADLADNDAWIADKGDFNTEKYNNRANAFDALLSDPAFMAQHGNDTLVRSMQTFLSMRSATRDVLARFDAAGGASTLWAVKNEDLNGRYEGMVSTLRMESPEFNAWYDRYFPNDNVTARKVAN